MGRIEEFWDGDWWYRDNDTGIWHKFQHKDYLQKIDDLFCLISQIGTENDKLIEALEQIENTLIRKAD